MLQIFRLLLPLLVLGVTSESARILAFFPLPSPSHHFVFRPVLEELGKRGHEVVYVTAFPYAKVPKGITQIALEEYDYENDMKMDMSFLEFGQSSIISSVKFFYDLGRGIAKMSMGTKEVQDLIHSNEKFDAVLFEPYFGQEYLSALIHKFNAIGIDVLSLGDFSWPNELAGLPDNPAYQLDSKSQVPKNMNFWQRVYNTYVTTTNVLGSYYYLRKTQALMDQYLNYTGWETRPPIDVLTRNRSLILVNFDYLLGYPYPVPPHRKDIGGININPNKPLPKDLQTYMDESKDGVIYMSLGSHMKASTIMKEIGYFLSAFNELPQRVLLKFEIDFTGEVPPNVKISRWLPQQDILAHNNCVLFITHGGLLSTTEAVYYGVPIVGVPLFHDQPKNILFAESSGFGRILRFSNITTETVSWTVREVLSNEKYKEEAVRRSKMFKDRRHTPAEEAVYWIEHSLKYPFALTPKAASLSFIQLHLIDVKLFIYGVLALIMYTLYVTCSCIKKMICNPKNRKMKIN